MWIESHQSIRNHPKIKKASRLAGVNEFEMIGRLHCLWWWALDYAPDGDVTKYSQEDIESAVDWTGDPGRFYRALIDCGFNGHCGLLEYVDDGSIVIHDWHNYGGRLLEKRELNAQRMRDKRASHVQNTSIARTGATEQTEQTEQNSTEDNNDQPAKPGLSELQSFVLQTFGAKRFRNGTQSAIVAAWDRYPIENVKAACTWAATKGFGLGQAIASLEKALPKWGAPKDNGQHANTTKRTTEPQYTPEQLAAAERINAARAAKHAANG
jgi:hypothetical protein